MAQIRSFRDLVAWQKGMELCKEVYNLSRQLPGAERFGLSAQLRSSAVSVPSNIAEGYGRGRPQDYLRFLRMARGSLYEVDTQLALAVELGLAGSDATGRCADLTHEVDRVLSALIRAVRDSATERE